MFEDMGSKFGKLGEDYDAQRLTLARLENFVEKAKAKPPGLKVSLADGTENFGDGSAQTLSWVKQILAERLVSLLDEVVTRQRAATEEALSRLQGALGIPASAPTGGKQPRGGKGDGSG